MKLSLTSKFISTISLASAILLSNICTATEITVEVRSIDNKPIKGLITYLLPLDGQKMSPVKATPLLVYQSNKKFSPYLSVIRKGMKLTFINNDNITHQIYAASKANRFSFRVNSGAQTTTEQLTTTGKVLMGCNIHDWMSGYLLVVDTPLYAKTNSQGKSTIKIPAAGRYQLSIWHPQLMEQAQTISREIVIPGEQYYLIKLTKKMAAIPEQINPSSFDFEETY